MTKRTPLALLLALFVGGPCLAAENNFMLDQDRVRPRNLPDGPEKPQEVAAPLPPWPRDADLITFVPDGPSTPFQYAIDGKHLSLHNRDTEVHYTLVITAASGTRNLSFEGMRCGLQTTYKTFAYGSDGRFMPAMAGDWEPVATRGGEAYRDDLRQRFCVPREMHARPIKDMLRALRGRISATDGTGFQAQ